MDDGQDTRVGEVQESPVTPAVGGDVQVTPQQDSTGPQNVAGPSELPHQDPINATQPTTDNLSTPLPAVVPIGTQTRSEVSSLRNLSLPRGPRMLNPTFFSPPQPGLDNATGQQLATHMANAEAANQTIIRLLERLVTDKDKPRTSMAEDQQTSPEMVQDVARQILAPTPVRHSAAAKSDTRSVQGSSSSRNSRSTRKSKTASSGSTHASSHEVPSNRSSRSRTRRATHGESTSHRSTIAGHDLEGARHVLTPLEKVQQEINALKDLVHTKEAKRHDVGPTDDRNWPDRGGVYARPKGPHLKGITELTMPDFPLPPSGQLSSLPPQDYARDGRPASPTPPTGPIVGKFSSRTRRNDDIRRR